MNISHFFNSLLPKVGFISISASCVSILLMTTQSAQAELVIQNSKDASGRAKMVVNDNRQKELPPAQLGISPSRIDEMVSLTQNKNLSKLNQSLTLYNYGSKPKVIKLNVIDVDESGKPIAPNESTLKPWTLINPTEFTIAPNGYQTVRMSIRLPVGFEQGVHSAMLIIEQQIDKSLTYDSDGKGVTLELGSRYGLPIHLDVQ
ncbi:hypothetical protein ACTXMF_08150 [Psychrobacter celer]|jgi:hypothetical protein|uniref:hypothetical protein n=1 Tax=Psychrobacter celer TaxID=306572 RepID=UPI003FD4098C